MKARALEVLLRLPPEEVVRRTEWMRRTQDVAAARALVLQRAHELADAYARNHAANLEELIRALAAAVDLQDEREEQS